MKPDDAIVNDDVSAEDAAGDPIEQPEPNAGREPTERELRLAEIARQYNESNGYPAEESEETDEQDLAGQEAGEKAGPEQEQAEQDPYEELGYYRNASGELVTKMKINGEEREVKADQVKAYLQKDIAGDYKLQQASERERQLQEREQRIQQQESQAQQSLSKQPSKMDAEESRQQAKAVLARIWDGDDEAAADALADYIQRNSATVDHDQLLQEAESRAMSAIEQREAQQQQQAWQASTQEGIESLRKSHADIFEDPRLFNLVDSETARMVEAQKLGDPEYSNLTPKDIIARAANEVQGWMDGRKEPPKATADNSREARKASLKPMPRAMSKQPAQKKSQEVDTSPAAVVERMRQARAVNS